MALALLVAACAEGISLQEATAPDAGAVDGGVDALPPDALSDAPEPNDAGPLLTITAPADGAQVDGERFVVSGTATDSDGLASVFVQVASNTPVPAQTSDGYRTWSTEAAVPRGAFEVRAWGYDADGLRSELDDSVLLVGPPVGSDDGVPRVEILEPEDGSVATHASVVVRGTAFDDGGVVRLDVLRNGELLTDRRVETDSFYAEWVRVVPLLPGEANTLEFIAYDRRGSAGAATLTLTGRAIDDRDPPMVEILTPSVGEILRTTLYEVRGRASDAFGVRSVEIRTVRNGPDGEPLRSSWVPVTTADAYATFTAPVTLVPGAQTLEVRAIDLSGLTRVVEVPLQVDVPLEYGDERSARLRLRPDVALEPVRVELGRDRIGEVLNEEIQREILLLELDPTELLRNTMNAIKTACGTAWRNDSPTPNHDCSLTELGRSFRGSDGTWRTSAEYALVRLLTMTPANVQVAGTSIAGLQELADGQFFGIRIGGGFSQILSDSLGIPRTTEITGTESVVASLREYLIATHPAATPEGNMPVTLYDALNDLRPLGERFGPSGDHPGAVDPSFPSVARVFEEDASMVLETRSNLRWVDGIELGRGKDYMAVVVDTVGPSFADVLEFDFTDPDAFRVEGLVERPTTNLRFAVVENDAFVPSCNGDRACVDNLPGSPTSSASYWAQPKWQLETIIARAAFLQYRSRVFSRCYINFLGCQAEIRIGQGGLPTGWTEFDIILGLGNPPRDQYIWELISEVGQVALHRVPAGTIAEGQADVAFSLRDIDVGVSAADVEDAVRPFLQDQAGGISDLVLGDFRSNNGNLDFFYRLGADGRPYLYFVDASDPRPVDRYPYTRPGFFSDPSLSEAARVSERSIAGSGDTVHEKLQVVPGLTEVYVEDDDGVVWRLRIEVGDDPTEVVVRYAPRLR